MIEILRDHIATLAGQIGERNVWQPVALQAAADYIRREWEAQGYIVAAQTYTAMEQTCANLEITIPGGIRSEEIVLIGAHYDTVPGSPGADDNASGIAGLLEISRVLRATTPERTVRLVAFVNEEAPFFNSRLMGSTVYARAARSRRDDIRVMLSLEMLGYYREDLGSQHYPPLFGRFYPDRGNFIGFVSNLRSWRVLRRVVQAFRAHSDFPCESLAGPAAVPGVSLSDQFSFWRQGYSGVMVTDTAFYRNPYYHQPEDTPEKLCYPEFARVVNGLAAAIGTLAGG